MNKCPKPSGQGFRPPQNQANARLNLENSSLKKCPKPSGQGFRPPPPNGQCPNRGGTLLKGASVSTLIQIELINKKRKTNFQKIKISFIRFSVEIVPSSIGGSPAPSAHLFVFFLNIQFRFLVILKCRERRKLFARSKSEKTMSSMPIPVSQACQQLVQHRC